MPARRSRFWTLKPGDTHHAKRLPAPNRCCHFCSVYAWVTAEKRALVKNTEHVWLYPLCGVCFTNWTARNQIFDLEVTG